MFLQFLQDTLDALFNIMMETSEEETYDTLVFNALASIDYITRSLDQPILMMSFSSNGQKENSEPGNIRETVNFFFFFLSFHLT